MEYKLDHKIEMTKVMSGFNKVSNLKRVGRGGAGIDRSDLDSFLYPLLDSSPALWIQLFFHGLRSEQVFKNR